MLPPIPTSTPPTRPGARLPAHARRGSLVATVFCALMLSACGGGGSGGGSDPGTGGTGSGSGTGATDPGGNTGGGSGVGGGGGTGGGNPPQVSEAPIAPVGATLNSADCALQYRATTPTERAGADPLLSRQWFLSNTGQSGGASGEDTRAVAAWSSFPSRGAGVRVAVVDDGLELTHEDLAPNVVPGGSHNYVAGAPYVGYPMPCSADDNHGTGVAGLIAARDGNAAGGAGVAPRASLVGFNPMASGAEGDFVDALSRDLALIGVYNNSWGPRDDGFLHPNTATLDRALQAGVATGRNGLGALYVFAGGNGGCYYHYSGYGPSPTVANPSRCTGPSDNSNFDGRANSIHVIAACAANDRGLRPWFGERGANQLVCGMAGAEPASGTDPEAHYVTTTDLDNEYREDFSGTSATAPQVSGVIALMLAERPQLSMRDVRLILARSARQNAPSDSGWVAANGLHYNPQFGFGVVDAEAAVRLARDWTSVGGHGSLVSCAPKTARPGVTIADAPTQTTAGAPASSEIRIDAAECPITQIEFATVKFVSDHTYGGDLRVELVSPAGLVSELATSRLCYNVPSASYSTTGTVDAPSRYVSCRTGAAPRTNPPAADRDYSAANDGWTFSTVRHLDESPVGTWTLRVIDEQRGDTGTLDEWTLTFSGR